MSSKLLESCVKSASIHLVVSDKWKNAKYEYVKSASTTAKGNFGEDLVTRFFNGIGIEAEVVNGGIGDFDIHLSNLDITLEHKLATQDTKNNFQFNAIDKDKYYDYVFCLGITPNSIYFDIVSKAWIKKNLTTRMTKADGGYKMTKPLHQLHELNEVNLRTIVEGLKKNDK